MFPYADYANQYWAGYFTSRANSKSQVRFSQANLHASNKVFSNKVIDQTTDDSEIQDIMNAKDAMFDAMGIYQHHDAITGTAKQAVSNNYAKRVGTAMDTSNTQYKKIVSDYAANGGIVSDQWEMCSVVNGTYHDCPTHEWEEGEYAVTAHNPSAVESTMARIKVPPANYNVQTYQHQSGAWEDAKHSLLCYKFTENNWRASHYTDCELFIDAQTNPHHFSDIKISKLSTPFEHTPTEDHHIQTAQQKLTFTECTDEICYFEYQNSDRLTKKVAFSMEYYNPANGTFNGTYSCASGAYLFKPKADDQVSHIYSKFEKIEAQSVAKPA